MNISLFGYGKMGKAIEGLCGRRGHQVTQRITSSNLDERKNVANVADVIIEFSTPETAYENIDLALNVGVPIIVGTTGWLDQLDEIKDRVANNGGCVVWASNFSVGVNLFFELNRKLAQLMNPREEYMVEIDETHHIHKLDAPSGTAITLAEGVIEELDRKEQWALDSGSTENDLVVRAHRIEEVPGTHVITYSSDIDNIEIKHEAKSREGFALGSIVAAEWAMGKSGVFTMKDVLNT